MASNSITINGRNTFQTSSPTEMELDQLETKEKVLSVTRKVNVLPGESVLLKAPPGFPLEDYVSIEPFNPNSNSFFEPNIVKMSEGKVEI